MKKCMFIIGTRPEAIKMAPVIKEFKLLPEHFTVSVCTTGQHREMLKQVLNFFDITADFDLDVMVPNQNLYTLTATIINELRLPLESFAPDFVFVHGDTTTAMAGGIASFYSGAKVCHIEAGLRTHNKYSPFPEEMNRQIVGRLADYHFSPTPQAEQNLLREGVNKDAIIVTGNTVIDALFYTISKNLETDNTEIQALSKVLSSTKKRILVTGHRRENHGEGFVQICQALRDLAIRREDIEIVYPVHLNPKVKGPVFELLSGLDNIKLIEPLSYPEFVWLMNFSHIIVTDSGGIQEEAPSLGKPVLVMRETTERPEALVAGTVILVGTDKKKIVETCLSLLDDQMTYEKMSALHNPYGDGEASTRIADFVKNL